MDLAILLRPSADPQATRACLESLTRTLPSSSTHERLLFEKPGFTPPSTTNLRVLPLPPTGSLAAARNAAVAASRAPLLCFLSPGVSFLPGWLPPMLDLIRRAPHAGCVGNVHREPYSGLIDHAGLRFDAAGLPLSIGRNQALLPRHASDRHPAVSFACCLVTRALFDQLNGFDDQFHGPLGDVDFCLRAAALGYRHYVANRSAVYHDTGADGPISMDDSSAASDLALYSSRWGDRARAAHVRRAALRRHLTTAPYSPEGWEMARETRRLQRRAIRDTRRDGFTYLCKHLHRPWRYNYARVCRALLQAFPPCHLLSRPRPPDPPGCPPTSTAPTTAGSSTHPRNEPGRQSSLPTSLES